MKNLKYSLLLSASLLVNVQICWAMIEEDTDYERETVYHRFENSSISYRKGLFEPSSEDSTLYTTPRNPDDILQCKQVDKNISECFPIKTIPMQIGQNQDERVQITQTTEWPHRIHGQLKIRYGKIGEATATGILVGPHHVLTAGHNVYNNKFGDKEEEKWANSISISLGLNEDFAPFKERKVVKAYTFRKWVKDKEKGYDMALLLLDQSIGNDIGYAGLLCLDDKDILNETVTITGYPDTKMMTMSHKVKDITSEEIYYNIYTARGQSGSGIWINKCGSPYVLGVHTHGEIKGGEGNSGTRLSSYKFKKIIGWMSQNYVLDNTSANNLSPSPINKQHSLEDYFKAAIRYETGEGVQVNKSQAKRLYEFAAKKGHLGALCKLGDLYYSGKIVSQNVGFSVQLYRFSAQKNYAEAQFNLGWMYENGQGVKQDQQEALKWYKLAAKQGHGEAINRIQVLESAPKKTTSIPQPQKKALKTPTKKINKRSKKYIQHMKSLENQPKITEYFTPIRKVTVN